MSAIVQGSNELKKDAIGVSHVVFFVVAAASPLTAVVGSSPAAFAFGNGAGVPATYLLVGILYLFFSVGFTTMNKFVGSAGGFYPYIASGLGRPTGVAGAFIALATYYTIAIAVYGLFGFFLNDMVKSAGGPDVAWWIFALGLVAVVHLCGTRNIEFSGKVLGICMIAEIIILLFMGVAVLLSGGGPEGISISGFGPEAVATPGLGVALVFVVASFIGFEATAIFGEEARDPKKTIPRATYISVIIIAVFYAFVTWCLAMFYGPSKVAEAAAANTATLYLTAVQTLLGNGAGVVMNLLLVTSMFACCLSFHNTINRYLFAIGREKLAWSGFGRTHDVYKSPYMAGMVQTCFTLALIVLFAATGQDPYAVVFAWMGAFASVGILMLQVLVCLAVIVFFTKDPRGVSAWSRLVAPLISVAGLGACLVMMIANISLVSGSESMFVQMFPVMLVALGASGFGFACWIKSSRPAVYENLGKAFA